MKNLKIENGDIVLDSVGKVITVSDKEFLMQSLVLRLKTVKGELFYNEDYGHPVLKGKQSEDSMLIYLKDTLMDDVRIFDIQIIKFEKIEFNQVRLEAILTLNTGELLDFDFII